MAFDLSRFIAIRPYVYHLTSSSNLKRMLSSGEIQCASKLLRKAGKEGLITKRRNSSLKVVIDGHDIEIRDQQPLYEGKTQLVGGWTFQDLIATLNDHVFFWPGTASGPIDYGVRHYERYIDEKPAILRIKTANLIETNAAPLVCKYNSGSPRTTQGTGSPRGPDTFIAAFKASFLPSQVRELTFKSVVSLPSQVESSATPYGPWTQHQLKHGPS